MKIRSASHPRPPREPRRDRVRVRALENVLCDTDCGLLFSASGFSPHGPEALL